MIRNMDYNYATVMLEAILLVFFCIQYEIRDKKDKYFCFFLASVLITALMNILADFVVLKQNFVPEALVRVVVALYMIATVLAPFSLATYVKVLVAGDKKRNAIDYINNIIFLLHVLSCLITSRTDFYYTIEGNVIRQGRFYIIIYLISAYYLAAIFIRIMTHYNELSEKQLSGILIFVIVGAAGAVCQWAFLGDNMVVYFIYALSSVIVLFTFETPDYYKLMATTKELEKNKIELEGMTKRSEELTESIHVLMNTASWYLYFDEDGNITDYGWSPHFKNMLGYADEDDVKLETLWQDSLHLEDKAQALKAFDAGFKGEEYKIETRLRHKDGSYKWYLCSGEVSLHDNGNVRSYQGIIKDIDDDKIKEKLNEDKLKALDDLEKSQRNLRKALFEAEEANRAKTTFLSNMSHDIRTPMNAIVGFTELAQNHIDDPEEVADSLSVIKSSSEHLLSLINDVLDMSRIESGKVKVDVEKYNIEKIMEDLSNLSKANVEEKKQSYKTVYNNVQHKYVKCDRLRLNQVLINCIGNAIKYTPEGGAVTVSLSETENEKSGFATYTFTVEDNGIGMSEEFLEKLFEPFERAKGQASQIQGTGLGMAITKNLVDMMNGNIAVESTPNVGSKFIISIPLEIVPEDEFSEEKTNTKDTVSLEEMARALKGKHFLVVDDNKLNRKIAKRLLADKGMTVEEAESGKEAIARLEEVAPGEIDMIFMDIQMPEMNGYETMDAIQNLDNIAIKTIPVIAMTANAFEEDKKQAKEHGMVGHVAKPFKIENLVETLYALLIKP